jgi:fused signal recognition particle receptor
VSEKPETKPRRLFGFLRRPGAPAPGEPTDPPAADAGDSHSAPELATGDVAVHTAALLGDAPPGDPSSAPSGPPKKPGWFQRLKAGLTKTSARLSEDITGIFTKRKLDADTLQDLEDSLIRADLGVETAMRITAALSKGRFNKEIAPDEVRAVLAAEVERTLAPVAVPLRFADAHRPQVILVVGVNGTGKTTTIGKMANKFVTEGRKVTMAAGDTFRAAAVEQLKIWGQRTGAEVISRNVGADSAGLAYDALQRARENGTDVLLIDTAGRLQNKQALMDELEKVIRVLRKIDPSAPHHVLLVLDATTGQNALNQVEVFKDRAGVTGLVMTKLDGTARGGILVAISAKFGIPVHAIGVGEGVEDLAAFDAGEFARAIALG